MMRRLGQMGRSVGNRIESLYNNRRGIAGMARNVLGTAKGGIRLLGRTNEFANRLGVSSPQMNNIQSNLERFGNPSIDFADSELQNV